ncbi:MAG TPA: cupredoxin domain-containing protein [Vicinamibacterales bacterium]|nr:cupredoxin domain-containing protein [Vicinamibacterales bacterium]
MTRRHRKTAVAIAAVALGAAAFWARAAVARAGGDQVREVVVSGDNFAFSPSVIEVQKDDLVRVTFGAKDMAHSFTIDVPYRISKRAGAGQSVVFEFRADEAGRFPFYCNLTQDERCKKMRGELVVR